MNKFAYLAALFTSVMLFTPAHAHISGNANATIDSNNLELAKNHFDEMCVRARPEVVLNTAKVKNHSFELLEKDRFIYGLESAKLADQQSIVIKNQGCESYTWQVDLVLNAKTIEQNKQFCDECFIQQLESYSALFREEDKNFYINSIMPLRHTVQQHNKLKTDTEYHLEPYSSMPHIATILELEKPTKKQYKVSLLFFVGPL
ncbi:hypothetical protein ACF3NA_01490 [Alkanindiges sp. WGS2144]|uniref:hypothetical protein n=1 Tax=Alkanindiges sp. WGS2144 TaxID=3366808 RepID=UPI00375170CA